MQCSNHKTPELSAHKDQQTMKEIKIIYLDSPAFGKEDMVDAFKELGVNCIPFFHENYNERRDEDYEAKFDKLVEKENGQIDMVFSFNFYPILSNCCQKYEIPYVAYVYDSPLVSLFSYTILNSCNHVYLFDSAIYEQLSTAGIKTVHYLPLAGACERWKKLINNAPSNQFASDVSFVGSIYNEDHNFFDRLENLPERTKGYLDAIMDAQLKVIGSSFIEELLTDEIIKDMHASVPYEPNADGVESLAYVYANYFIARKLTSRERLDLLSAVGDNFPLTVFTRADQSNLIKARFPGTVDYYSQMPIVFAHSKINLNITLRSITKGIPLRGMDIMGAGGFLLTNYQNDFNYHFVAGEDYEFYTSKEEMLEKIEYYLSHDKERTEIAANGLQKMQAQHTYLHRAQYFLNELGLL